MNTQAICESMDKGWKYKNEYCVLIDGKIYNLKNIFFLMMFAKLLQARLVEEGWEIEMTLNKSGFIFFAWKGNDNDEDENREIKFDEADSDSEPAAIVALYCKVKGIEVGHE